ncbi:hypothetical protein ANCCAN_07969 [Ancylostoma caninum]|uniref:Uncharacterized protein n=1 Tax=Ancylostoma caninum TaxID=29170 RepID=A0A368GNT6_ANCCA|nr:hypothetical protein ANCCAN_07969 [Ancylostoma caninum]
MHGWMNIVKFSCTPLKRDILVGIAIARVRFRLKEVYLWRQNTYVENFTLKTIFSRKNSKFTSSVQSSFTTNRYWTTTARSIITRDVQKIADLFVLRFSKLVSNQAEEELRTLNSRPKGSRKRSESLLQLSSEAYDAIEKTFPINLEYTTTSRSRASTFTSLSIPVKSRVMVVQASKRHSVLLNLSKELTGAATETLDNCAEPSCSTDTKPNGNWKVRNNEYHCTVKNAVIKRLENEQDLIVYQISRPSFKFDTLKRRTAHGVAEVKQEMTDETTELWTSLIRQQSSLALEMHHKTTIFSNSKVGALPCKGGSLPSL